MSPTTTRWVFFVSLLWLLPLPFYHGEIAWLPVARVFFIVTAEAYLLLLGSAPVNPVGANLLLAAGTGTWVVLLWMLVSAYIRWAKPWPSTVRGSVMGLLVFSLLILLSSVPAYRPLDLEQGPATFLQVYD